MKKFGDKGGNSFEPGREGLLCLTRSHKILSPIISGVVVRFIRNVSNESPSFSSNYCGSNASLLNLAFKGWPDRNMSTDADVYSETSVITAYLEVSIV